MKPLALMMAAAAAACAPGGSNEAAPARTQENVVESQAGNQGAPGSAGTEARTGGDPSSPGAQDVPIASSDPSAGGADQCGASRYQWLVGRSRSAIPAQPSGADWRVTCTSCPITEDYSPARLNIFYDSETERIEEVRCG